MIVADVVKKIADTPDGVVLTIADEIAFIESMIKPM